LAETAQNQSFFRKAQISPFSRPADPMQTVLTIAGFDPSSGAGVTADLMVFAAHGLFGTSCITALTVQSTLVVRATHAVSGEVVRETLDCLDADLRPEGIKIGMLSTGDNANAICRYIANLRVRDSDTRKGTRTPIVLDPVLRSSSGKVLLEAAGLGLVRERLLPLVDYVTPNLEELSILAGVPVQDRNDVPGACRVLQAQAGGQLGVLATGGHLDPPDDFLLVPGGEGIWLAGERVNTRSTHGTGCALSSAFLSRLVLGDSAEEAAKAAKLYVAGALRAADGIGKGRGPMKHLWPLLGRGRDCKV
jgi:hydroxymethylpyrimidine/phosphomethylpyrimidine kinase